MVSKVKKFIIFLFLSFNLFSNEIIFQKGVEYYKEKKYKEAVDEWSKLEKDYLDWRVFYNIGNAYAKLNKIGYAMLYYEKALKIKPDEKRIEDNINFLKYKLKDKIEEEQKTLLRKTIENFYKKLNFNKMLYPFFFSFLLINFIITFYLISPKNFPKFLVIISSFLIALLLISSIFLYHFWWKEKNVFYGIIVEDTVEVKSAPMNDSTDLFIIHEGLKVRVYEEVEGYLRIVLPNGMSGFILKEAIKII
jgi:tetratricopeptide (TPR) repeat protein